MGFIFCCFFPSFSLVDSAYLRMHDVLYYHLTLFGATVIFVYVVFLYAMVFT